MRRLHLNRVHTDALGLRAAEHLNKGEFDDSIADCDAALAKDPNFNPALSLRGLARLELRGVSASDF